MAEKSSLFPVFDVPGVLAEEKSKKYEYKTSPLFDVESGEFVLNGARQTVYGSSYDAWVLWCTKTIMTERWAHDAYSGNIGIESVKAFRQSDRKAAESVFERTITEALLADPAGRTRQVYDFKFDWKGDSLSITCTVIGADGKSAVINAEMTI